jgi:hypothetical protein
MKAHAMRQFKDYESLPKAATYIGSTEGPNTMSEATADEIDRAAEPAFFKDEDGSRHFFELATWSPAQ